MNALITFLMWYGIVTVAAVIGFVGMVVYDRIKYGPLEDYYKEEDC